MEFVTLNNGVKMPKVGFGVYQIKDHKQCKQAVLDAIDAGYRLIDTAQSYGNEEAVGKAFQEMNCLLQLKYGSLIMDMKKQKLR